MLDQLTQRLIDEFDLQLFGDGGNQNNPPGGNPPPGGGQGHSGEVFSADYVRDLRNESAEYRTKLRAAETARDDALAKHKALEDGSSAFLARAREVLKLDAKADLATVTQKLAESVGASDTVSKKAQEALLKAAFLAAASKANLVDVDAAYKLADLGSVKVDLESMSVYPVDKDGKQLTKDGKPVTGLDDVIQTLIKAKPYLAGKAGGSGIGSGSNPGPGDSVDEVAAAKKLAEERNKGRTQAAGGFDPWAPKQTNQPQ